jgi:hypothetical protein
MNKPIITIFEDNFVDIYDARRELQRWDVDARFPIDSRAVNHTKDVDDPRGAAIISTDIQTSHSRAMPCGATFGENAITVAEFLEHKSIPYAFVSCNATQAVQDAKGSRDYAMARAIEKFYNVQGQQFSVWETGSISRMMAKGALLDSPPETPHIKPWRAGIAYAILMNESKEDLGLLLIMSELLSSNRHERAMFTGGIVEALTMDLPFQEKMEYLQENYPSSNPATQWRDSQQTIGNLVGTLDQYKR